MYNQEWKENYLTRNNFAELKKEEIVKAFNKASTLEIEFIKDLCKFNMPEVKELIQWTDNKYTQIYYDYSNWCICESLINSIINPYDIFIEDED